MPFNSISRKPLNQPLNLDPPLETADIETSSDSYAMRFSGPSGEWFLRIQSEITMAMLPPASGGTTILEVGGGHGQLTPLLLKKGYKIVITGSHPSCSKRIHTYLAPNRCEFIAANPPLLPFPDRKFDSVISYRFVSHTYSWERFLAELARVAARNVLIDYPPIIGFNLCTPLLFSLKKYVEGNTRTYRLFFERQIIKAFRACGFVTAGRQAEFFLPMVLHRILNNVKISQCSERLFRSFGLTGLFGSPVILKFTRRELAK